MSPDTLSLSFGTGEQAPVIVTGVAFNCREWSRVTTVTTVGADGFRFGTACTQTSSGKALAADSPSKLIVAMVTGGETPARTPENPANKVGSPTAAGVFAVLIAVVAIVVAVVIIGVVVLWQWKKDQSSVSSESATA
jgi:hypothetical protein